MLMVDIYAERQKKLFYFMFFPQSYQLLSLVMRLRTTSFRKASPAPISKAISTSTLHKVEPCFYWFKNKSGIKLPLFPKLNKTCLLI